MRPLLALIPIASALLSSSAPAAPDFAPNPKQAFPGFVAINPPRSDVPIGALWIDGCGPTGDGADKDNLETVKSLSTLTVDKSLQLSLSLGLLQLFGIDPKAHDHYTARFSDLSLVRVKDVSKLPGIKGEPRIIEALKAGSVTITSDTEIGLDGQNTAWQRGNAQASGNSDRTRQYSIEAHDMYIAVHVATAELTQSKEQQLRLGDDGQSARIDDFLVVISRDGCKAAASPCRPALGIEKINTEMPATLPRTQLGPNNDVELGLPVPIADGQDGLYTKLAIRWVPACSQLKVEGCGKQPRLFGQYEGTRLKDVPAPKAKGW